MTNRRTGVCLLLAVLLIGGCAGARSPDESDDQRVCLKVREIKSFNPLDRRHVLIKARVNDYYLFTVDRSCDTLAFAQGIAVEGNVNQVCDDGFGSIVFDDSSAGVQRCRIIAIDAVEDIDAARALIAARAQPTED